MSGHAKKVIEQGALTTWRPQREGLVTERKQPSKGHSQPGDHRGTNLLGHRKKATK